MGTTVSRSLLGGQGFLLFLLFLLLSRLSFAKGTRRRIRRRTGKPDTGWETVVMKGGINFKQVCFSLWYPLAHVTVNNLTLSV
jgi:hypothetical protein